MTREEAKTVFINRGFVEVNGHQMFDGDKWRNAVAIISKWLEQEPCTDAVSRQAVNDLVDELARAISDERLCMSRGRSTATIMRDILHLPPVTPKEKTGKWLRMSDLSEQKDDRYKCSYCGNVVHYRDKMNLYTFNSWCGTCGSNNGARMVSE